MAKVSKEAANYRNGDPRHCCGYCTHYEGGKCDAVEGNISPYKISDIYKPYNNPQKGLFHIRPKTPQEVRDGLAARMRGMRMPAPARADNDAAGKADADATGNTDADVTPPRRGLRIGRKSY